MMSLVPHYIVIWVYSALKRADLMKTNRKSEEIVGSMIFVLVSVSRDGNC